MTETSFSSAVIEDPTITMARIAKIAISEGRVYPNLTNLDGTIRKLTIKTGYPRKIKILPLVTFHEISRTYESIGVPDRHRHVRYLIEMNVWCSGQKVEMPDGKDRDRAKQDRYEIGEIMIDEMLDNRLRPISSCITYMDLIGTLDIDEREIRGTGRPEFSAMPVYRRSVTFEVLVEKTINTPKSKR